MPDQKCHLHPHNYDMISLVKKHNPPSIRYCEQTNIVCES